MMGLLRSDLCVLEEHRALLPAGFGLFLLCVPLGLVSAVEFVVLTALLLPALPLLARHKAEDGGFWAYLAAGPLGRRRLVLGKYLEALLAALVPLASIPLLLLLARSPLAGPAALRSAAFGGGLGCFVAAGALPIRFKLGGWHGMGWQFLWGAGIFLLLVFGGGILALSLRVELAVVWAWSLLPGAALLGVSYPLSLRFYRTREF